MPKKLNPDVPVFSDNEPPDEPGTPMPALGSVVTVQIAPGRMLLNNETGAHFAAEEPTSQVVTTTLLRRLQAGDLILVTA